MGAWRRTRPSRRPYGAAARREADSAELDLADVRLTSLEGWAGPDPDFVEQEDVDGDL